YYYIDWGDGTDTPWIGPYSSGIEVTVSHVWEKRGDYTIKVKAKDDENMISDWATFNITIKLLKNQGSYFKEILFNENTIHPFNNGNLNITKYFLKLFQLISQEK
ncbi:MAG: hypothetical protein DRN12_08165, partial [Thermoplasmata archaeon]